ncbi:hypothetical protein AC629_29980 [Bradyrhizobium sp. NAS80.1]|uniref:hypothetical protein n=1 Tax=Bradyrhizobium sp. NAS80.1 TaxID=1680159 RepID=UPI00096876E1|nr:hypothetical protein [Bradyrhizobium sp. NAS80.1]OKO78760.1 hypothetical protein AC629_29980 [Bradyrhizobium sp. NAS80.1]
MLKDGTYRAWFTTPLGQGTGIAHVAGDKIWGCDSIMNYSGTCHIDGERFTAVVYTKRHTPGHATVFGADHSKLAIEGTCAGKIGRYAATAEDVPGILLDGILILCEEEELVPKPTAPAPALDPGKLRKLPRLRTR